MAPLRLSRVPASDGARKTTLRRIVLAVTSGALLGLSFPPLPFSLLALVGFLPLLILFEEVEGTWRQLRYAYLAFLVFNAITLYWVGGFVDARDGFLMLAGGLLVLLHPFFFLIPVWFYLIVRKRLSLDWALVAFPFLWVGFEYAHALGQIAFPWITLGNSQALDPSRIQYVEWTGVYGVSFWIVLLNVLLFSLVRLIGARDGQTMRRRVFLRAAVIVLLVAIPEVSGRIWMWRTFDGEGNVKPLRVGLVQPNVDPWEKWQGSKPAEVERLREMTASAALGDSLQLLIWPETAIPYYILQSAHAGDLAALRKLVDTIGAPLLTGFPNAVFYPDSAYAPRGSKRLAAGGDWYESFNAAMLLDPRASRIQTYGKILLVPFGERPPYVDQIPFLAAMMWDIGLGMWNIGRDTTVFSFVPRGWAAGDSARFSALVCYESIYPGFVRHFVHKGAEFIVVITNDSWYGKTDGPYQHEAFAALRAIENRRWVVRCANGGISCLIDPDGRFHQETTLFTQAVVRGEVTPLRGATFYSSHGDLFAQVVTSAGLLVLLVGIFIRKGAKGDGKKDD